MHIKNATAVPVPWSYRMQAIRGVLEIMMGIYIGEKIVLVAGMFVLIIGSIALFSFLDVASWSDARRKEREAYYTAETLKKIAESSGEGTKSAVEYLQEQNRNARHRRLEGMILGGLITAAVGIGLMVFLQAWNTKNRRIWWA